MKMQLRITRRRTAAFTLMELLLVLGIIAMLIGGGTLAYRGITESARETKTVQKVMTLDSMIQNYKMKNTGRTPADLSVLKTTGFVTDDNSLFDEWGEPILFNKAGTRSGQGYDLFSKGRDKQENTPDDIGNWSTGS